jgi:hypothetical protein
MSQYTTPAQLDGLFKEAYGDDVLKLVPDVAKLVKMVKFVSSDKENGEKYNQPVILSNENGVTYAAAGDGAFTLKDSVALTMKNAEVQGSQMLLRTSISYDTAAKASNSKKAFVKATELIVENMMESITKRLEVACLYGQTGLGVIASSANTNATTTVLTLTEASWAAGIWAGMEGAKLNAYYLTSLISSGADAIFQISAVDIENRKLTVTGTSGGITALDSDIGSHANTDVLYFDGAYGKEMAGIDKILTNTGSLFGIDAAAYSLWKSNTFSCSSADATMGKILKGIAQAVNRGLNEDVDVFFNPITWGRLNADSAALRKLDQSYSKKKLENGAEAICFYGQNGEIRVQSHSIVKQGEGFALPMKKVRRIGSQEISFKRPGGDGEKMFRDLSDAAGYELRVYTDQAIFIEYPARCLKFTTIVNS